MSSAPSQSEELRNTIPVRYLPFRPSGPRRLPFQNLQQLHVADLLTIICAANRQQYEQRLPPATVRELKTIVCGSELVRRFFRDAFWWLYLMHFSDIDLDLLLNVAQKNVLLSSADAALMSMEAIRKRTQAMAPKAPPQTAMNTSQRKQQLHSSNNMGRRGTMAAIAPHRSTSIVRGSGSADVAHDLYRQRMVSLANDTFSKLQVMKAADKGASATNEGTAETAINSKELKPKPKGPSIATVPPHLSVKVANRTTQQLAHVGSPSTVDTQALTQLLLKGSNGALPLASAKGAPMLPPPSPRPPSDQDASTPLTPSNSRFMTAQRKLQMKSFSGQDDTNSDNESELSDKSPSSRLSPVSAKPPTYPDDMLPTIPSTTTAKSGLPSPLLPSALTKVQAKDRLGTPPKQLTFIFGTPDAPDPHIEGNNDAFGGCDTDEVFNLKSDSEGDDESGGGLEEAMALRTFGATLVDTEDDSDAEGLPKEGSRAGLVSLEGYAPNSAPSSNKKVAGTNISLMPEHQRAQVVQAEHHKLFSRMAMNYGQLLTEMIYSKIDESPTRSANSPASAPKLGRFESRVQRDAIVGYLPDLLAQGLHLAFALALPFAVSTLLDADFQLSILRHMTFWIHGIESTQRFVLGSTIQLTNPSAPSSTGLTPPRSPEKNPLASPLSATTLAAVSLPRVFSLAAVQRQATNPTVAAQDARAYKASASVSSWPANAIITMIGRRRKEFWQQVKEGTAHPVTDYPKCTLDSLRLIFKGARRRVHKARSPPREPVDATGASPSSQASTLPTFSLLKQPSAPVKPLGTSLLKSVTINTPRRSNGDPLAMSINSNYGGMSRHAPHPPPHPVAPQKISSKEEIVDRQVTAFCREIQRVHTTHTFASANNMLPPSEEGANSSNTPSAAYVRDKNAVGAASRGMDTFLDNLAKQQRRESQGNSQGKGRANPSASGKAAASQLLAQNGIDVSGQITTVRNVHVIKKELDDKCQPVAPWYMRPTDRIRKRTGQLYYLLNGGIDSNSGAGKEGATSGRSSPDGTPRKGASKEGAKASLLNSSNAIAAAANQSPSTGVRFTLTNWSPLIQRYMLIHGNTNTATPESMAWTMPQV